MVDLESFEMLLDVFLNMPVGRFHHFQSVLTYSASFVSK